MHIAYDTKGGAEYAKLCTSVREGAKVRKEYAYLGRVLDKEAGIYKSRERGVFTYDAETGEYGRPPAEYVAPEAVRAGRRALIVDFGDAWLLDHVVRGCAPLDAALGALGYGNPDTLRSMLSYYVLCQLANCHAADWWAGSYASVLWPRADLTSQRVSEFLAAIGDEAAQRRFFAEYVRLLGEGGAALDSLLIDSTGLPNSIHFPLTAVSNHNGEVSNEVRLVYAVHQETGLPIYMRYCPGNVVDVSTLRTTIAELREAGVNTKFAILDAGYYSEDAFRELSAAGVSFLTRMRANLKLYRELVAGARPTIEDRANLVEFNGRYVYVERADCEVAGRAAHAYVCLDVERRNLETHRLFGRAKGKKMDAAAVHDAIEGEGFFALLSTRRIAKDKVLPLYYTRQQVEQVFDIGKNYANLLPLRVQSEETFRGHLMLTFAAAVAVKLIQDKLKKTSISPQSALLNLRNQKCKVYSTRSIPQEANKKANECYRLFKVKVPTTIPR